MSGKSLSELNLSNDPLTTSSTSPTKAEDPRGMEWYRFSSDITELLATGKYTWAERTLEDIQVTVEKTQRVTDGQRRAVRNIEEAAERSRYRPRTGSRRYEGYGR